MLNNFESSPQNTHTGDTFFSSSLALQDLQPKEDHRVWVNSSYFDNSLCFSSPLDENLSLSPPSELSKFPPRLRCSPFSQSLIAEPWAVRTFVDPPVPSEKGVYTVRVGSECVERSEGGCEDSRRENELEGVQQGSRYSTFFGSNVSIAGINNIFAMEGSGVKRQEEGKDGYSKSYSEIIEGQHQRKLHEQSSSLFYDDTNGMGRGYLKEAAVEQAAFPVRTKTVNQCTSFYSMPQSTDAKSQEGVQHVHLSDPNISHGMSGLPPDHFQSPPHPSPPPSLSLAPSLGRKDSGQHLGKRRGFFALNNIITDSNNNPSCTTAKEKFLRSRSLSSLEMVNVPMAAVVVAGERTPSQIPIFSLGSDHPSSVITQARLNVSSDYQKKIEGTEAKANGVGGDIEVTADIVVTKNVIILLSMLAIKNGCNQRKQNARPQRRRSSLPDSELLDAVNATLCLQTLRGAFLRYIATMPPRHANNINDLGKTSDISSHVSSATSLNHLFLIPKSLLQQQEEQKVRLAQIVCINIEEDTCMSSKALEDDDTTNIDINNSISSNSFKGKLNTVRMRYGISSSFVNDIVERGGKFLQFFSENVFFNKNNNKQEVEKKLEVQNKNNDAFITAVVCAEDDDIDDFGVTDTKILFAIKYLSIPQRGDRYVYDSARGICRAYANDVNIASFLISVIIDIGHCYLQININSISNNNAISSEDIQIWAKTTTNIGDGSIIGLFASNSSPRQIGTLDAEDEGVVLQRNGSNRRGSSSKPLSICDLNEEDVISKQRELLEVLRTAVEQKINGRDSVDSITELNQKNHDQIIVEMGQGESLDNSLSTMNEALFAANSFSKDESVDDNVTVTREAESNLPHALATTEACSATFETSQRQQPLSRRGSTVNLNSRHQSARRSLFRNEITEYHIVTNDVDIIDISRKLNIDASRLSEADHIMMRIVFAGEGPGYVEKSEMKGNIFHKGDVKNDFLSSSNSSDSNDEDNNGASSDRSDKLSSRASAERCKNNFKIKEDASTGIHQCTFSELRHRFASYNSEEDKIVRLGEGLKVVSESPIIKKGDSTIQQETEIRLDKCDIECNSDKSSPLRLNSVLSLGQNHVNPYETMMNTTAGTFLPIIDAFSSTTSSKVSSYLSATLPFSEGHQLGDVSTNINANKFHCGLPSSLLLFTQENCINKVEDDENDWRGYESKTENDSIVMRSPFMRDDYHFGGRRSKSCRGVRNSGAVLLPFISVLYNNGKQRSLSLNDMTKYRHAVEKRRHLRINKCHNDHSSKESLSKRLMGGKGKNEAGEQVNFVARVKAQELEKKKGRDDLNSGTLLPNLGAAVVSSSFTTDDVKDDVSGAAVDGTVFPSSASRSGTFVSGHEDSTLWIDVMPQKENNISHIILIGCRMQNYKEVEVDGVALDSALTTMITLKQSEENRGERNTTYSGFFLRLLRGKTKTKRLENFADNVCNTGQDLSEGNNNISDDMAFTTVEDRDITDRNLMLVSPFVWHGGRQIALVSLCHDNFNNKNINEAISAENYRAESLNDDALITGNCREDTKQIFLVENNIAKAADAANRPLTFKEINAYFLIYRDSQSIPEASSSCSLQCTSYYRPYAELSITELSCSTDGFLLGGITAATVGSIAVPVPEFVFPSLSAISLAKRKYDNENKIDSNNINYYNNSCTDDRISQEILVPVSLARPTLVCTQGASNSSSLLHLFALVVVPTKFCSYSELDFCEKLGGGRASISVFDCDNTVEKSDEPSSPDTPTQRNSGSFLRHLPRKESSVSRLRRKTTEFIYNKSCKQYETEPRCALGLIHLVTDVSDLCPLRHPNEKKDYNCLKAQMERWTVVTKERPLLSHFMTTYSTLVSREKEDNRKSSVKNNSYVCDFLEKNILADLVTEQNFISHNENREMEFSLNFESPFNHNRHHYHFLLLDEKNKAVPWFRSAGLVDVIQPLYHVTVITDSLTPSPMTAGALSLIWCDNCNSLPLFYEQEEKLFSCSQSRRRGSGERGALNMNRKIGMRQYINNNPEKTFSSWFFSQNIETVVVGKDIGYSHDVIGGKSTTTSEPEGISTKYVFPIMRSLSHLVFDAKMFFTALVSVVTRDDIIVFNRDNTEKNKRNVTVKSEKPVLKFWELEKKKKTKISGEPDFHEYTDSLY